MENIQFHHFARQAMLIRFRCGLTLGVEIIVVLGLEGGVMWAWINNYRSPGGQKYVSDMWDGIFEGISHFI